MSSKLALIVFLGDADPGLTPGYPLPQPPVYPSQGLPGWNRPVDPGYSRPGFGPGYPSTGFPPNYPSQGLPSPGYPTTGPVFPPVGPDNTLPPEETPNPPSASLPIFLPSGGTKPVEPDQLFELKYSVVYGWVLVPTRETAEPKS